MTVIGLHSTRACGKDTLCSHLAMLNPNIRRFAFADALKRDLSPLIREQFGFDIFNCTATQKELVRPILIAYGMAWREVDPLHWVKVVISEIEIISRNPDLIPVITDVRFENEAQCLSGQFGEDFCLVDLQREGAPSPTDEEQKHYRKVRAMAKCSICWENNTYDEQRQYARDLLNSVGLETDNARASDFAFSGHSQCLEELNNQIRELLRG